MREHCVHIDTSYGRAPGYGGFLRFVPSVYSRQEDGFMARLSVLKEAFHNDTMLAEEEDPYFEPPFRRMLERVARGLGATVSGKTWCGITVGEPTGRICEYGIGHHEARVLIVGHAASHRLRYDEPELPFISPNRLGCAFALTMELEKLGIPERELYWVNALDRSGLPHDAGPLLLEPWRRVVALGHEAAGWAESQGLQNVVSVPPPHWWFKVPRKTAYRGATAVAEALGR